MQLCFLMWQLFVQIAAQTAAIFCMPVFWIALLLLTVQIWLQQVQKQRILWNQSWESTWNHSQKQTKQTANSLSVFLSHSLCVLQVILPTLMAGWFGGIIASALLLLTGTFIENAVLLRLWGITVLLFFVQKRFVCFAYAGGIVALLQCCLGNDIAIAQQILMLVAVLHFTEALLVRMSGSLQTTPVYLRDKQGRTTTGVQLQMIWPLPLAMPVLAEEHTSLMSIQAGYITMPDWWPLFTASAGTAGDAMLYQLVPMLAAIGYHDLANEGAKQKTSTASRRLLQYSILLSALVLFSCKIPAVLYAAALFSIAGHEIITRM